MANVAILKFDTQGAVHIPDWTAPDDLSVTICQPFRANRVLIGWAGTARQNYIQFGTENDVKVNIAGIQKIFTFTSLADGDRPVIKLHREAGDSVLHIRVQHGLEMKSETISNGATITFNRFGEFHNPYNGIRYDGAMYGTVSMLRTGDERRYNFNGSGTTLVDELGGQNGTLTGFSTGGFFTEKAIRLTLPTYLKHREPDGTTQFQVVGTVDNADNETVEYSLDSGATWQVLQTNVTDTFDTIITVIETKPLWVRLASDNNKIDRAYKVGATVIFRMHEQSNGAGQGENNQVMDDLDAGVPIPLMVRVDEGGEYILREVADPITSYTLFDTIGGTGSQYPAIFENYANRGIQVVMYSIAVGGTGIEQWSKGYTGPLNAYYENPEDTPSLFANMGQPHAILTYRGEYEIARGNEGMDQAYIEYWYDLVTNQHYQDFGCHTIYTYPTSTATTRQLVFKAALDNVIANNEYALFGGNMQDVLLLDDQGPGTLDPDSVGDGIHVTTDAQIELVAQARYDAILAHEETIGIAPNASLPQLPSVSVGAAEPVVVGEAFTITDAVVSDADSITWECFSGQSPTILNGSTTSPTITTNETGNHSFKITATNENGTVEAVKILNSQYEQVVETPSQAPTLAFTHIETNVNETETRNGVTLTRFTNPQGTAFGYGLTAPETYSASNINLVSNNATNSQQIAKLVVPHDLAALADKTTVQITVNLSGQVSDAELQVLFSEHRTSAQNRFTRTDSGAVLKMNFNIVPLESAYFRVDAVDEFSPQEMRYPHRRMDSPITTDLVMPISIAFSNDAGDVSITSVVATATVGPSQFNVNGKFRNGKDEGHVVPYQPEDTFNQPLPSNLVTQLPAYTFDTQNADAQGGHFTVTSGSDLVSVATTEGVRVGDVALICFGEHGFNAERQPLQDAQSYITDDSKTLEVFGVMPFVAEVVDATTLRLSKSALASYTPPASDWATRIYFLATFTADHASMLIGQDANSWSKSILTGTEKADIKASAYMGTTQIHYCSQTDPLERFNFNRILTTQAIAMQLEGFTITSFGNVYSNGYFEIPTPASFNSTYDQATNYDRGVVFITPSKRYAIETYLTGSHDAPGKDENGHYNCDRVNVADLFGRSVPYIADRPELAEKGISKGSRAFGGNINVGVVRKEELDVIQYSGTTEQAIDNDLTIAENAIQHAIALLPSSAQMQSSNYTATIDDQSSKTDFYSAKSYAQKPVIVNGGSGYAINDVLYLVGDALVQTRLTVTQVGSNGEVLSAFCTHTGMYWNDVAAANHATTTSGSGTGATVNSIGYIEPYTEGTSMQSVVYPASVVDTIAAKNKFAGAIPMGGIFTIDPSVDLRAEYKARMLADYQENGVLEDKHSLEFYAVLCAIQKYGTRIVDVASDTIQLLQLDSNLSPTQRQKIGGLRNGAFFNMRELRSLLVPVHNYTPYAQADTWTNEKPVIDIVTDNIDVEQNTAFTDADVYAYDDFEGDISDRITTTGNVNTSILGTYPLTYNVSDLAGNTAVTKTRNVNVIEAVIPTLPLFANFPTQTVEAGVENTLTGSVTGGTGNYTISWRYSSGPMFDLSSNSVLNPTITPVYDPQRTRAVYTITVSDGVSTITESKEINVIEQTSPSDPPIITLTGGNVALNVGEQFVEPGYSAYDSNGTNITSLVVVTGSTDTSYPRVGTLEYNVTDSNGNQAETKTRILSVTSPAELLEQVAKQKFLRDNSVIFAFTGRANIEELKFKLASTNTKIALDNQGFYDFSENETQKVIIVTDAGEISSENGDIVWSGSSLYVRFGAFSTRDTQLSARVVVFLSGDDRGVVIAGPGLPANLLIRFN